MTEANQKKKVLIVEDDISLIKAVSAFLNSNGFEVIEAANGAEGLIKAMTAKPDIILLDILMPKMDGVEMLEQLRKKDWGRNMKVVTFSNLGEDSSETEKTSKYSTLGHLVKSEHNLSEILERLREYTK